MLTTDRRKIKSVINNIGRDKTPSDTIIVKSIDFINDSVSSVVVVDNNFTTTTYHNNSTGFVELSPGNDAQTDATFLNGADDETVCLTWPKFGMVMLFSLLIIVTIIGNTLVILSVMTTRRLRTVTNCFVMSLAMADWLVGVTVMPPAVFLYIVGKKNCYILCSPLCRTFVSTWKEVLNWLFITGTLMLSINFYLLFDTSKYTRSYLTSNLSLSVQVHGDSDGYFVIYGSH